jgi:LPXTG-motif cell wall-anchored protein
MPGALTTYWDGPTLSLNWRGNEYASVSGTFLGEPVSVPGDQSKRTLNVRNDGPCLGNLTVELTNAVTTIPEGAVNLEAEDLITVRWNVQGIRGGRVFSQLVQESPLQVATIPVQQGEVVPVTLGYEFPFEATTGKNMEFPSAVLSFDVSLVLRGDACPGPLQETHPVPHGSASPPSPTPRSTLTDDDSDTLPHTGTRIAGVALPVAGALVGLGALLFGARRRRSTKSERRESPQK